MRSFLARRHALGALGVLACFCVVGAEWASLVHHVTTRHAVCPEHGHVVDLESAPHQERSKSEDAESGLSEGPTLGSEHAHHHCGVVDFLPVGALSPRRPVSEQRLVAALPRLELGRSGGGTIPLLLLAPKSSPPACS